MFTPTPKSMPDKRVGTLKAFKTIDALFAFFNEVEVTDIKIPDYRMTYKQLYDFVQKDVIKEKIENEKDYAWLGTPLDTVAEVLARDRYLKMEEFNNVYKTNIQPRIQEILKDSSAELELPTLKYNDLGLGQFDFNKASSGLIPLYKYYSFKKKENVEGVDVVTYKDKGKFKYKLKSDGSPVVLVPKIKGEPDKNIVDKAFKEILDGANLFETLKKYNLKIGGTEAFTSTVKKSYVLKEKVPKPKNAVRIFIKIGANADVTAEEYKWSGYAAIGIAELLSIMGYAVSIIAIYGCDTNININGKLQYGTRFWGINLKSFEDTLDKQSLLYVVSDPTFFRVKIFDILVRQAYYYKDYLSDGLGSSAGIGVLTDMVFTEYGKRDRLFNDDGKKNNKSEFLYYIIGGLKSENDLNQLILKIGLDVVNQNKEARLKILGLQN
jgi:hypothetical protein